MITNTTYKMYKTSGNIDSSMHGDYVPTLNYIKDICVDKQPVNDEILLKSYGSKDMVTNRLFYPFKDAIIDNDCVLKILNLDGTDKEVYEVRNVIRWDSYTELLVCQLD